jgi:hypothetical protein
MWYPLIHGLGSCPTARDQRGQFLQVEYAVVGKTYLMGVHASGLGDV